MPFQAGCQIATAPDYGSEIRRGVVVVCAIGDLWKGGRVDVSNVVLADVSQLLAYDCIGVAI